MRKVFIFWIVIFFVLILGAAAIIYGKQLLREEIERAGRIREGLALPRVPEMPELPVIPQKVEEVPEVEVKEMPEAEGLPAEIESPEVLEVPESEAE